MKYPGMSGRLCCVALCAAMIACTLHSGASLAPVRQRSAESPAVAPPVAAAKGAPSGLAAPASPARTPWEQVPAGPPSQTTRLRVSTPGTAITFAPIELGMERGLFQEEGLQLELSYVRANVAIAALVSGGVDYHYGLGSPIRAAAEGVPIKVVAGVDTYPLWLLVAPPSVQGPRDLKGAAIGSGSVGGSVQLASARALAHSGLDPVADISWFSASESTERLVAMQTGQLQAAVVALPVNLRAREMGFKELLNVGDTVKLATVGLITAETKIQERPDEIKRMIRGTIRSTSYFLNHPEEAIALIAQRHELSAANARLAYEQQAPAIRYDGSIPEEGLKLEMEFSKAEGRDFGDVPIEHLANLSLIREVQSTVR